MSRTSTFNDVPSTPDLSAAQSQPITSARLEHLDMVRGLAAILVMAGHLRSYLFPTFSELGAAGEHVGPLTKVFYIATSLGHMAVLVFFALSGFLIGSSVLHSLVEKRFSWSKYTLRRLTRLWIVAVPALLLTLAFDMLGWWLTGGRHYSAITYEVGQTVGVAISHSATSLLGNLFFLQSLFVPCYGSNAPLWSLAYEFWYYLVFPLAAWLVLYPVSLKTRIAASAFLVAICYILPTSLFIGGLIWLVGAATGYLFTSPTFARFGKSKAVGAGACLILLADVLASRFISLKYGDVAFGVIAALTLPFISSLPSFGSVYNSVARFVSEISYTLYLTHYPFLTFIVFAGLDGRKWHLDAKGALVYMALIAATLIWAAALWWCFERHTQTLYKFTIAKLRPEPTK